MVNNQSRSRSSLVNRTGHPVRHRLDRRSTDRTGDRRVRRTEGAVVSALIELVLEKRYEAITIQDLLERADVGRSTFYAHYRGKDDLLLRSFERMLESLAENMRPEHSGPRRIAPVRELFRHVGEFRRFHRAIARAHMQDRVYEAGTDRMSSVIARKLDARPAAAGDSAVPVPVRARALAGALFALLAWWVETDPPYTPEQMDTMYHSLLTGTGG